MNGAEGAGRRNERWSPRTAAAHTFAADLDAPVLGDDERHHLQRVRRLRAGDVITVGDGRGRWRAVRLGRELEPCGPVVADPPPQPTLTIGFAPPKGDRPAWVVQKLTEVGVDRIVPLIAERSVVRWEGERGAGAIERLRRVAREAAAQSRRTWLPGVMPPVELETVLRWEGVGLADVVGVADDGEVAADIDVGCPRWPAPSLAHPIVLVGPEGGWSLAERTSARQRGVPTLGLGPHVLRTDTAAVVAGVLLVAARWTLSGP
jgi:16S rRNA (uracil1498-N3)-methyltransferase